jgi:hypothetical protein
MSDAPRPRCVRSSVTATSALAALAVAGVYLLSGLTSTAFAQQVTTRCSVLAQGQSCSFGVSGNPALPYIATIPAGVSTVTAVIEGGTGANGDDGAAGGAGGVVVMSVPVNAGEQLALWVGANANSYDQTGEGWANGGLGVASGTFGSDSGAGGGASAINDDDSDALLAVAGGGGGAGGSYNNLVVGGNGGAGGVPAGDGASGGSPQGGPYKGGGGQGGSGGGQNQAQGGDGGAPPPFIVEGGGGGGGGYAGGSGGDPSNLTPDAGGGGGAGSSYVDPAAGAQNVTYASAVSPSGGSITLIPGASVSSFGCVGASTQSIHLSSPTAPVFAIVAGAPAGNDSDDTSTTGLGAIVTAQLAPDGVQNLAISVGCTDETGGYGNGGEKGYAGEAAGADGGFGGGGSAIINPASGNAWLVAGGGGGAGGQSLAFHEPGGTGGNAGLGWASAGAGSGGDGGGSNPTNGGQGGAYTSDGQPVTYGDSPAKVDFEGGGAGGGGGGIQGGDGGDTINDQDGGGGGGAGASSFDGAHAIDPSVSVSSKVGRGGSVVIVQEDATSSNSDAARRSADRRAAHTKTKTGSLKVSARAAGNGGRAHSKSVFTVRVLCRSGGLDVRTPGGATFGLSAGRTRTLTRLPVGARCRTDQINDGQATHSMIRPANVTIRTRHTTTVITNTFTVATLTLRLTARPGASRRQLGHRVPVYVLCRPRDAPASVHYPLPGDGYIKLIAGTDRVLRQVPTGARCSVAPLDHHYATTAQIDRQAIVTTHRHALLRITDHLATPRYRVSITPTLKRMTTVLTARPDDRIVVARARRHRGLSASVAISRLSGWMQIINRSTTAVTVRVSRNGRVGRHIRIRAHYAGYIRP